MRARILDHGSAVVRRVEGVHISIREIVVFVESVGRGGRREPGCLEQYECGEGLAIMSKERRRSYVHMCYDMI